MTADVTIAPGTYYWCAVIGPKPHEFVAHRAEVRADGRALSVGTLWAPLWAIQMAEHNRLHRSPEEAIAQAKDAEAQKHASHTGART